MTFDPAEFLDKIGRFQGEYPQQKLMYDRMDALRWSSRINETSPQNMLLIGESGVGKTHLVRKYVLDSNAEHAGTQEGQLPVVYVQLPLPFSMRNLYHSIQESLGNAVPEVARSTVDLQRRTLALLETRNVEMVIFDEAHHIGMSRNVSITQALESMIHLGNMANAALVLVGPEEIRTMQQHDMRFFRRFSLSELRRFEFVDGDYIAFLRSIEAQITPFPVSLSDTQISTLLYKLSQGLIGILMPLIQFALRKVVLENSFERIDVPQFVDALFEAQKMLFGDDEQLTW
ncbi:TniB family NTP-binding protein [Alicyclobacillus suci]|uniref:TniB family NTP-binding protein n=1 Tax=Alicyclobacillus suci TaxID=2816080 RepID=UPI001A8FC236|nr:TniB family NTP-binding protein [Alicyclobacillus suci]